MCKTWRRALRALNYIVQTEDRPNDRTCQAMNAPSGPSEMNHEDVLRVRLEVLKRQHRDLDIAIEALHDAVNPDQLTLKRLKKQKLMLKDQIARIEDELIPDILA